MPGPFAAIPLLFADKAAAPAGVSPWAMYIYLPPVVMLFYLLILRPHHAQERKRRDLLGALKKNDRVLTSAGIYGTVVSVNPDADRVVVRIDDERGVKVEFTKASITRVVDPSAEKVVEAAEKSPAR